MMRTLIGVNQCIIVQRVVWMIVLFSPSYAFSVKKGILPYLQHRFSRSTLPKGRLKTYKQLQQSHTQMNK